MLDFIVGLFWFLLIVGGALSHTITSTSTGAFPLAIATVGFEAEARTGE